MSDFLKGFWFVIFVFFSSANIGHLELLIFDDKGEDLGEVLINKGFAVLRSDEYIPRESECLLVD